MTNNPGFEKISLHFDPKHLNACGKQVRDGLSAVMRLKNDLWLACDESTGIERLTIQEDGSYGNHKSFHLDSYLKLFSTEIEVDIEGLSFCENYLWFIGSHSLKRKKVKFSKGGDERQLKRLADVSSDPNRYIIARIPFEEDPDQEGSLRLVTKKENPDKPGEFFTAAQLKGNENGNALMDLLKEDIHIKDFIPIPGKDNGFDIEGLAISDGRMFVGLRGPVLRGWAIILELRFEDADRNVLELQQQVDSSAFYKKYFIRLEGLGIRELCIDGQDILILAGPTMELNADMALYRWRGGVNSPDQVVRPEDVVFLENIPHHQGHDKAEGVKLYDNLNGKKRLVVVYDTPAGERKFGENSVFADLVTLDK